MRNNPIYYIYPGNISLTPNANESPNDLAVYIADNTKIKVRHPRLASLGYDEDGNVQEWLLTGRNRRLANTTAPHTIYARLSKADDTAYLVFAAQTQVAGVWTDKYAPTNYYESIDELHASEWYVHDTPEYWYVRLGSVSAPVNDSRTVELDTGILGTDRYNTQWDIDPDSLPYRVEISKTIAGKEAGATPRLQWGESIDLVAHLVQGWNTNAADHVHHWTIVRNSGNAELDAAWNNGAVATSFDGTINLQHCMGSDSSDSDSSDDDARDDFDSAFSASFIITAYGEVPVDDDSSSDSDSSDSSYEPSFVIEALASASITILSETVEAYELETSSGIMAYNAGDNTYSPADGIYIYVRAKAQDGSVSYLNEAKFDAAGLHIYYSPVESDNSDSDSSDVETELDFTGNEKGYALLDTDAFDVPQKSMNVYLVDSDGEQMAMTTVGYVKDGSEGEPGGNTATIYLYKRLAEPPTQQNPTLMPSGTIYYNFNLKALFTDQNCTTPFSNSNGWYPNVPSGSDPIYITAAVAYAKTSTDGIGDNEWASPSQLTENGINSATVFLYRRSASAPEPRARIIDTLYYKFADGNLYTKSGTTYTKVNDGDTELNGWHLYIPASNGNPCYVMQAAALSTMEYDAIEVDVIHQKDDWSEIRKLVEDGEQGISGTPACQIVLDFYSLEILLDEYGQPVLQSHPTNHARFYSGNTLVSRSLSDWTITTSAQNQEWRIVSSVSNNVLSLDFAGAEGQQPAIPYGPGEVTVSTTYQGQTYTAVCNLNFVLDSIEWELVATPASIVYNLTSQQFETGVITVNIYSTNSLGVRSERTAIPTGWNLRWDNGSYAGTLSHVVETYNWTFTPSYVADSYRVYISDANNNVISNLSLPVVKTSRAVPRPRVWEEGSVATYLSGGIGEKFVDVVTNDGGNTWKVCTTTLRNVPAGSDMDDYTTFFSATENYDFISTYLLLAQMAFIKNLGVQYLRMGGWSGATAPAGYEPTEGYIEMYDQSGKNLLFQVRNGNVIANIGTFNNVRVNGTVNAVTGTFSGHIKSVPTIIHAHNIADYVTAEINPFTGEPQFMLNLSKLGRNTIFFTTQNDNEYVPHVSNPSYTGGQLLQPQGYGAISSALQNLPDYDSQFTSFQELGVILPFVYRDNSQADHDFSGIVSQFAGDDYYSHNEDSSEHDGSYYIGLRNLYRRWRWEKGASFDIVTAISAAPMEKPEEISDEDWNEWQEYPYITYMNMVASARDFVGSEMTLMQLCNTNDGVEIKVYGAPENSDSSDDGWAWESTTLWSNPGSVATFKCIQNTGTTNVDDIYWERTTDPNAVIYYWDRYTLNLGDWDDDSSSSDSY